MLEIDLIRSPLIYAGLVGSLAASLLLLRKVGDIYIAGMVLGFLILSLTKIAENYCIGGMSLSIEIEELGYLCNPALPHIKGIGFLLVAIGLIMHAAKLNNHNTKNIKDTKDLHLFIGIFVSIVFLLIGIYSIYLGHILPAVIIILTSVGTIHSLIRNKSKQ